MTFWLVAAAMSALAIALLLWPLRRPGGGVTAREAYDLEIYRDQLAEIDRDVERGLLPPEQAEAARIEIGRRLLAADDRLRVSATGAATPRRRLWAVSAGVVLPLFAAVLYLENGAPQLADGEPPPAAQASDGTMDALLARLAQRLRESPDDLTGWTLMARSLFSLGRFAESAAAFANASALAPGRADLMARQGEALTFANGGTVTPRARALFESALKLQSGEFRARYYLGLAALQAGHGEKALAAWRELESDAPADAEWMPGLRQRIARLAAELGDAAPGPTAADVAAAREMSADDRDAMIRSMVARLAERLESEPGDAEGWLRLGRSYGVLGEPAKARDAYARAAALRPQDAATLARYAGSIVETLPAGAPPPAELTETTARILVLDPAHRDGLWLAGLAAQLSGRNAEAAGHWRKLLAQLAPDSPEHDRLRRRIDDLEKQ